MNETTFQARWWQTLAEIVLIFAVFFLHGAYPVPDSNEAHYLAKAKHYWNPDWGAGDFFLESADAHQAFYWTFGWLTLWLSLEQTAWVGRALTWLLLAWGWQRLSFAAVPRRWLAVLTAAVFVGLSENAHMAGEWVIGGVEAKGFSYALLFFALASIVRGRWAIAWLQLGAATALHVLVGGWAMIAAAVAWVADGGIRPTSDVRRPTSDAAAGSAESGAVHLSLRAIFPALVLAVALALPSLYFGLSLTVQTDAETIAEANRIYVYERLPHHLLALSLAPGFLPRHLLLHAVWLLYATLVPARGTGERSLRWFVATAIGICWIGLGLNLILSDRPELLARMMRYYWFRSSDVIVPLGAALGLASMISITLRERPLAARGWLAGTLLLSTIDTVNQFAHLPFRVPGVHNEITATPRPDKNVAYDDWIDTCRWIAENTEPSDIVLSPRSSATLKWYTGRPEVATWKDVPQDARSIVEWWGRINALHATGDPAARWYKSFSEHGPERLRELMDQYRARYVIVPLREDLAPLEIEPLHKNESFAVYRREQLSVP